VLAKRIPGQNETNVSGLNFVLDKALLSRNNTDKTVTIFWSHMLVYRVNSKRQRYIFSLQEFTTGDNGRDGRMYIKMDHETHEPDRGNQEPH